jgi:hypothetical protein
MHLSDLLRKAKDVRTSTVLVVPYLIGIEMEVPSRVGVLGACMNGGGPGGSGEGVRSSDGRR